MTAINSISFGELLREWRTRRQLSQLQLATRASVSTRHLSYLETGRSQPSRTMIERLAGYLDVPLRERNQLMHAAGLAPTYPERGLDAPESLAVSRALQSIMDAHLPFPALLLDRWGDVVDRNAATDFLLHGCAAHLVEPPINALRLTLHPDGLAPRITNLGQWRSHLLTQVQSRSERDGDARLHELAAEVAAYPGDDVGRPVLTDVVVPLELRVGGAELRFFSISAAVESAMDVTVDELRIEAFYPADETTRNAILGMS
ncbi:helix-turn-helix domain-containing protein [Brevibacterium sp. FAM 27836]|uniref:helix-turn-helix domain-containing protein n=1 Tax=Brevibacterium sp. FAM 27836 TaxID=3446693 RepID=UPI003F510C5E